MEVFRLFFTEEICSFNTEQSNLYAEQILGEKYEEYRQITVEELKAYFGFKILMGLYPKPAMSDYWRRDLFVHYAPIADRIPRDRSLKSTGFCIVPTILNLLFAVIQAMIAWVKYGQ